MNEIVLIEQEEKLSIKRYKSCENEHEYLSLLQVII